MSEELEKKIAELEGELLQTSQVLAMVLNETGPVEIDRKNRTPLPEDAMIAIDIDPDTEVVTISLGVPPDAEQ